MRSREVGHAARMEGERQMELCATAAESREEGFGERAYHFIVDYVSRFGGEGVPGEQVTLAAKSAGIVPHDDRAFGSAYQEAQL